MKPAKAGFLLLFLVCIFQYLIYLYKNKFTMMSKKYIMPALLLAGGLTLIFREKIFGKPKEKKDLQSEIDVINKEKDIPSDTAFPLKRGSRGELVRKLQVAILAYDAKLLPKFGADGDFGSETENAVLKILGKKTVENQADIDKIQSMVKKSDVVLGTPVKIDTDAERIKLANQLKSKWEANKTLTFVTKQTTQIALYSDMGTEKLNYKGTERVAAFQKLESGKNIKSIRITSGGHIVMALHNSRSRWTLINVISVSPFAIDYK